MIRHHKCSNCGRLSLGGRVIHRVGEDTTEPTGRFFCWRQKCTRKSVLFDEPGLKGLALREDYLAVASNKTK